MDWAVGELGVRVRAGPPPVPSPTATAAPSNGALTTSSATVLATPATGGVAARHQVTTRIADTGHRLERLTQHALHLYHLGIARTT